MEGTFVARSDEGPFDPQTKCCAAPFPPVGGTYTIAVNGTYAQLTYSTIVS